MTRVLAVRLDNDGDVLLAGPAIRALAAGARAILVPTAATRLDEIAAASEVAPDLGAAVDSVLAELPARTPARPPVDGTPSYLARSAARLRHGAAAAAARRDVRPPSSGVAA